MFIAYAGLQELRLHWKRTLPLRKARPVLSRVAGLRSGGATMTEPRASKASQLPSAGRGRSLFRLDRIDRAIIEALQGHGRMTYLALSEQVGLSPRPCLERVRRLEQRGVIRGYAALIDPVALGHEIVALAEIAVRDPSAAARQRLERALCSHPSVIELQVVSGEYDYVARIVAPTLAAYEALTGAFLADSDLGIARIHTTFVLKTLKEFDGYPVAGSQD
jgi:Lrp/AsnC family leucine-responsive transcriptional regulator